MAERTLAWFNCFAGIAGDMALGALFDAGADLDEVRAMVARLGVPGWRLEVEATSRNGIAATRAVVTTEDTTTTRHWSDIRALLAGAGLPERVARRAHDIFAAIATVEARLHATTPENVHFHEVGGLDAIVDVVGVAAALEVLGIDEVSASPVATGTGVVRAAHGTLPNPAPAVVGLLAGHRVRGVDVGVELTTPTGAAIVAALATGTGPMPAMTIVASGFGAGTRELAELPNLTQVVVGTAAAATSDGQPVVLLEANLDDATGEVLAASVAALLAAGAHDAWVSPIVMKKGRPAHTIAALADPAVATVVRTVLVRETGSLGVRATELTRWPSPRETTTVDVLGHPVRIKVTPTRAKAEHDDAVRVAAATARPLREILARAEATWRERGT